MTDFGIMKHTLDRLKKLAEIKEYKVSVVSHVLENVTLPIIKVNYENFDLGIDSDATGRLKLTIDSYYPGLHELMVIYRAIIESLDGWRFVNTDHLGKPLILFKLECGVIDALPPNEKQASSASITFRIFIRI
ncbi:hypothetical protein [Candidatus Nucleicultrix amoebiphila]|jgi:hypothetical protein|uniref:Uncharacterized protein n=1 Tax=Candidatus Nucleicultrix amoebiphila FS5 TaxID=1414854 RepID=A0A1W6N3H2_9PROT|nr:hypothetical protein [Candidatus Nucleicultrix amoebiphila]ARN84326.1 hypothetical protein GQ61_02115 [Candidatus Nucleicultrix amoebiphila FS5]